METISGPLELIKKSVGIFFEKKNMIVFLKIYAFLIPFSIFNEYQQRIQLDSNINNDPVFLSVVSIVGVLYLVISFWIYTAGMLGVLKVVNGAEITVKEILLEAWKKLWKTFLVSILVFLVVLGGLVLLVIPGIIFGVWFAFSQLIYLDKGLMVKESMIVSKSLVVGRSWKIFGRLLVFGLFSGLVNMTMAWIPYLGQVVVSLLGGLFVIPTVLLYKELSN